MEFARTSPKNLRLILTARRLNTLKQIAEEIKGEVGTGVQVLPVKLDVSRPEEVKGFVKSLPADFQDIDVLVNNACVPLKMLVLLVCKALIEILQADSLREQQKRQIYRTKT